MFYPFHDSNISFDIIIEPLLFMEKNNEFISNQ